MSADLVRVAVIGLGLVSGPHLEGYLSDDRCELVAVCDVDDGRATGQAPTSGCGRPPTTVNC